MIARFSKGCCARQIDPFVFSSSIRTGSGLRKAKRQIDSFVADESGAPLAEWRFHDLRRTGASTMQRLRMPQPVIEKI